MPGVLPEVKEDATHSSEFPNHPSNAVRGSYHHLIMRLSATGPHVKHKSKLFSLLGAVSHKPEAQHIPSFPAPKPYHIQHRGSSN